VPDVLADAGVIVSVVVLAAVPPLLTMKSLLVKVVAEPQIVAYHNAKCPLGLASQ
jgi:hypothetical protein